MCIRDSPSPSFSLSFSFLLPRSPPPSSPSAPSPPPSFTSSSFSLSPPPPPPSSLLLLLIISSSQRRCTLSLSPPAPLLTPSCTVQTIINQISEFSLILAQLAHKYEVFTAKQFQVPTPISSSTCDSFPGSNASSFPISRQCCSLVPGHHVLDRDHAALLVDRPRARGRNLRETEADARVSRPPHNRGRERRRGVWARRPRRPARIQRDRLGDCGVLPVPLRGLSLCAVLCPVLT
eukprot:1016904-Rhodomonas_salina.1